MTQFQHILLYLIEIIEILPFVLFINCVLKAMTRYKQPPYNHPSQMTIFQIQPPETEIKTSSVDTNSEADQFLTDPWFSPIDDVALPRRLPHSQQPKPKLFLLPPAKKRLNHFSLNSTELRALCSEKGIKWRGVRGGKHLTKTQMIDRLITAA